MSYALLWIETLVLVGLWTIAWMALAGRMRRTLWTVLLSLLATVPPIVVALAVAGGATVIRIQTMGRIGMFWGPFTLGVIGLILTLAVLFFGLRRPAGMELRRAAGWPAGRLMVALLAIAAVWWMTGWNIELAMRSRMATLRAEAGATLLSLAPPAVSDSQNAALLYEQAFELMEAEKDTKSLESFIDRDEPPAYGGPEVEQFLARHARALSLIRQAAAMPDCYFDHDYGRPSISMLLPELNQQKQAVHLVMLSARHALARGRIDAAVDDLNVMFRMAEHAGRVPILISALVSVAIDSLGIQTLGEILPAATTPQQLDRIGLPDPRRFPRMARRAMAAEEAFGIATLCDLGSGTLSMEELSGSGRTPEPLERGAISAYALLMFGDEVNGYRRAMRRYRDLAGRQYYQVRTELDQFSRSIEQDRGGLFVQLLLPALNAAMQRLTMIQAQCEAARVAVAAARYRLLNGKLPERIEDFGALLDPVPIDPFDGKPMRWKLDEEAGLAYSVGVNGVDDGGMIDKKDRMKGDVGIRVKNPKQR